MNKKNLILALERVKPGLTNKEIINQSTNFAFSNGRIFSCNNDIAISHPVSDLMEFEGAVPGNEFYSFLKKVQEEEIKFLIQDKELIVSGERFTASFRFEPNIVLPMLTAHNKQGTPLPNGFIQAVKDCLITVGFDLNIPLLNCIHIYDNIIESCDNYSLTQYRLQQAFTSSFLLPSEAAKEIVKYEIISYEIEEGWVHFSTKDGCVVSCRTLSGSFPDLFPFLDSKRYEQGYAIEFPLEIEEALERASVGLEEDNMVNIQLLNNTLSVSSTGNVLRYQEKIQDVNKVKISFAINPTKILSIIKREKKATMSESKNMLKFDGESFTYIMTVAHEKNNEEETSE